MKKILICCFLFVSVIHAHKLNLFTSFENNKLYVSTYFANAKGCKSCKIVIKDLDKKVIFQGKTDQKGESFIELDKKSFIVNVDAGGGHIVSEIIIEKIDTKKKELEELKLNSQIEKLQDENQKLQAKIEALEQKLDNSDIYKSIFALFVIFVIFIVLKRVKK